MYEYTSVLKLHPTYVKPGLGIDISRVHRSDSYVNQSYIVIGPQFEYVKAQGHTQSSN